MNKDTATTGPSGSVRGFIVHVGKLKDGVLRNPTAIAQDSKAEHQPYMSAEEALVWMQSHARTHPGDDMQALTHMNGIAELLSLDDMDTIYGSWAVAPACPAGGECGQPAKSA